MNAFPAGRHGGGHAAATPSGRAGPQDFTLAAALARHPAGPLPQRPNLLEQRQGQDLVNRCRLASRSRTVHLLQQILGTDPEGG
ncbi:hypothetical protein [Deinococcus sonorensis]|uniref:Uncharacterized protein n=2 Tax=Deinococcus sonorensis TaxID=309891 RepID=A0AAU7U715_9DEIO